MCIAHIRSVVFFPRKLFGKSDFVLEKENAKAHSDEKVDHEEDVEGEVDLLSGVLDPGGACFDTIPEIGHWTKSDEK